MVVVVGCCRIEPSQFSVGWLAGWLVVVVVVVVAKSRHRPDGLISFYPPPFLPRVVVVVEREHFLLPRLAAYRSSKHDTNPIPSLHYTLILRHYDLCPTANHRINPS